MILMRIDQFKHVQIPLNRYVNPSIRLYLLHGCINPTLMLEIYAYSGDFTLLALGEVLKQCLSRSILLIIIVLLIIFGIFQSMIMSDEVVVLMATLACRIKSCLNTSEKS